MSKWNHRICADCWIRRAIIYGQSALRLPTLFNQADCPEVEPCCYCGAVLTNLIHVGIYVREDPTELLCKGEHNEQEN